jgi:hypothetical protein
VLRSSEGSALDARIRGVKSPQMRLESFISEGSGFVLFEGLRDICPLKL